MHHACWPIRHLKIPRQKWGDTCRYKQGGVPHLHPKTPEKQKQSVRISTQSSRKNIWNNRIAIHSSLYRMRTKTMRITMLKKQKKTQRGSSWCPLRSEEHVLLLDEQLHHLPLVADVVEGLQGVHVWRLHQGGPEDDCQVLGVHQVVLFVERHPVEDTGYRPR